MIRIITDSSSDITQARAKELNIEVMPLTVRFDEEVYKSGIDITDDMFYEKLTTYQNLPTTAQVNPYDFEEKFKEFLDQGDEIICILISSCLSGTCQSATIAKDSLDSDKITIIDSLNVCSALGLLTIVAAKMRDNGASVKEITDAVNAYIPKLHLYVALESLEYVKKGGRISPTVAFVGSTLGLHPIVSLIDGKIEVVKKAKGKKAAAKWMVTQLAELPSKEGLPMLIGHAHDLEKGNALLKQLEEAGITNILYNVCMGPTIGTYSGPGAIGIFYISD
ncbi:MAG: DegV family protein [Clostridia bacterium]|nr:DegV family protein [Clostridia bacterium]